MLTKHHRYAGYSQDKKDHARELRESPTKAYEALWERLRRKQFGVRFRRRHLLYGWIPDFWSGDLQLAVEIDYSSDAARVEQHRLRDEVLAEHGIEVLRVPSSTVLEDPDAAEALVLQAIEQRGLTFGETGPISRSGSRNRPKQPDF